MAELHEVARLHDSVVDDAAAWYDPKRIPDAFMDVDPRICRAAFRAAGGDWRRVVRDGTEQALTILNAASW